MVPYIVALIIAVVWGYFQDLKRGQVGWFVGRIVFMMIVVFILDYAGLYQY
ncbi:hypothetical protein P59_203 [Bacillus phage P59]|nr:hypothetical protein P59_203 [Bacillus phage P59]